MLTLPAIIKRTSRRRIESAKYVRLLKVKQGYTKEGLGYIAAQSYSTHRFDPATRRYRPNANKQKYVTVITFLDRKLHCRVSCSCSDQTFRWEFALAQKGAAEIEFSNGDPPVSTNPALRTASCKHLVKIYSVIKDKLKT